MSMAHPPGWLTTLTGYDPRPSAVKLQNCSKIAAVPGAKDRDGTGFAALETGSLAGYVVGTLGERVPTYSQVAMFIPYGGVP